MEYSRSVAQPEEQNIDTKKDEQRRHLLDMQALSVTQFSNGHGSELTARERSLAASQAAQARRVKAARSVLGISSTAE